MVFQRCSWPSHVCSAWTSRVTFFIGVAHKILHKNFAHKLDSVYIYKKCQNFLEYFYLIQKLSKSLISMQHSCSEFQRLAFLDVSEWGPIVELLLIVFHVPYVSLSYLSKDFNFEYIDHFVLPNNKTLILITQNGEKHSIMIKVEIDHNNILL